MVSGRSRCRVKSCARLPAIRINAWLYWKPEDRADGHDQDREEARALAQEGEGGGAAHRRRPGRPLRPPLRMAWRRYCVRAHGPERAAARREERSPARLRAGLPPVDAEADDR